MNKQIEEGVSSQPSRVVRVGEQKHLQPYLSGGLHLHHAGKITIKPGVIDGSVSIDIHSSEDMTFPDFELTVFPDGECPVEIDRELIGGDV